MNCAETCGRNYAANWMWKNRKNRSVVEQDPRSNWRRVEQNEIEKRKIVVAFDGDDVDVDGGSENARWRQLMEETVERRIRTVSAGCDRERALSRPGRPNKSWQFHLEES